MLVLSRKVNEAIVIGGNIRVTMTAIRSRQVRLAIEAPPEVHIYREELLTESHEPGSTSKTERVSIPPLPLNRRARPRDQRECR